MHSSWKRQIWKQISSSYELDSSAFKIFAGDFNAIRIFSEKIRGITPLAAMMDDFNNFILSNKLYDYPIKNGTYTWKNKQKDFYQIAEKLDRFLLFENWLAVPWDFVSIIHALPGFDHFPISLSFIEVRRNIKIPFKLEAMWFRDSNFVNLIRDWWLNNPFFDGTRMFQLSKKFQFLKNKIKDWIIKHFKKIFFEKL